MVRRPGRLVSKHGRVQFVPFPQKRLMRRALALTGEERARIEQAKRAADRRPWVKGSTDVVGAVRTRDASSLAGVSQLFNKNFVDVVKNLGRRFGKRREIRVLFEGAGMSTFPQELEERCAREGIRCTVVRTDVYSPLQFAELAGKAGVVVKPGSYVQATPEELRARFGSESFHLVVSRSGGLTYTKLGKQKGVANVLKILKPKGEAFVFSEDVDFDVVTFGPGGSRSSQTVSGSAVALRRFLNLPGSRKRSRLTPAGKLLLENPRYRAEEFESEGVPFLRIRKDLPPTREEMDRRRYKSTDRTAFRRIPKTPEAVMAYRTVFDLMHHPPLRTMSQEQFAELRRGARTLETAGPFLGRPGEGVRMPFGDRMSLQTQNGKYFITMRDELGVIKVLWRER